MADEYTGDIPPSIEEIREQIKELCQRISTWGARVFLQLPASGERAEFLAFVYNLPNSIELLYDAYNDLISRAIWIKKTSEARHKRFGEPLCDDEFARMIAELPLCHKRRDPRDQPFWKTIWR